MRQYHARTANKIFSFLSRTQHILPDGNQISVGPAIGAILGEALFNPQIIGFEGPGLADLCCECTVGQVMLKRGSRQLSLFLT